MNEYPRKHKPNPALGITEAVARQLDRALWEMEQGGAGNEVVHDPSSETYGNVHAPDIGYSSHALHRGISSNEQVAFGALVEKIKNENPELEHSEAFSRAVEQFDANQDEDEGEK